MLSSPELLTELVKVYTVCISIITDEKAINPIDKRSTNPF